MPIVNAPSETVANVNSAVAPFDVESLFRAHYARVARIIERVLRDRGRSEELAVEVFLKLWRNQKAQHENVEAWLYRVAVRTGIDKLAARITNACSPGFARNARLQIRNNFIRRMKIRKESARFWAR
jgi:DNA-directed RNA polymerase specialized sigma24 family protein